MTGALHRRVARLEASAGPGFDLAAVLEAGRVRVRALSAAELHREREGRAEEMRGRAAELNRMERAVLAGLDRALAP